MAWVSRAAAGRRALPWWLGSGLVSSGQWVFGPAPAALRAGRRSIPPALNGGHGGAPPARVRDESRDARRLGGGHGGAAPTPVGDESRWRAGSASATARQLPR